MDTKVKADYIKATKETDGGERAWRTGGLRFILALLVKEFGVTQVKQDLALVSKQSNIQDIMKYI